MLTAAVLFVAMFVVTQADVPGPGFFTSNFYYAARLIAAILIATVVPLQIDRCARRSTRIGR